MIGYDEVMKIPTTRVESRGAAGDRGAAAPARPAAVPVGRLLRDPPRVPRPRLAARRALLTAARQPPRRARGARRRRRVQGQRALARPRRRDGAQRARVRGARRTNTLVIFTTDHGMPFPGAKATLYDRGLGVMLILRGPRSVRRRPRASTRWSRTSTSTRRLRATSASSGRPFLQGVSLMPLLRGEAAQVREEIFAGSTWHAAYEPQRARAHDAPQVHPPLGRPAHAGPAEHRRRARARTCCCATAGPSARSRPSSSTTCSSTPTRRNNLVGDPALRGRARRPARPAASAGCARPTTRCSPATSTRRPAWRSTCPTSARRAEPTVRG